MPMVERLDGLKGHGLDATTADGEKVLTGPRLTKMKDRGVVSVSFRF